MKQLIYFLFIAVLLSSCATSYEVTYGSLNRTEVELDKANFNNLGTFSGNVTEKRVKAGIKNMEGLISRARMNMIENIESAGIEWSGSKTMTNIAVDVMKNRQRITVTVSADVIEFTD